MDFFNRTFQMEQSIFSGVVFALLPLNVFNLAATLYDFEVVSSYSITEISYVLKICKNLINSFFEMPLFNSINSVDICNDLSYAQFCP